MIFWLSQKFQRPILFDRQTELERKSDSAKLTEKISELIEILKDDRAVKSPNGTSEEIKFPTRSPTRNQLPVRLPTLVSARGVSAPSSLCLPTLTTNFRLVVIPPLIQLSKNMSGASPRPGILGPYFSLIKKGCL
jgi:hypothetical protein